LTRRRFFEGGRDIGPAVHSFIPTQQGKIGAQARGPNGGEAAKREARDVFSLEMLHLLVLRTTTQPIRPLSNNVRQAGEGHARYGSQMQLPCCGSPELAATTRWMLART